jgi:hypothetical protein
MSTTGSEYIAMAKHAGPPESGADHPAEHPPGDSAQDFSQDPDYDVDPVPVSPPARFGRLARWVASASALTVGVVATVAYGVWFDQDQRAYAKAMAVAQQTLSAGVATVQRQQTLSANVAAVPEQQTLSAKLAAVPEQQTPAAPAPTMPTQQTAWSGRVAPASPPLTPPTSLADAAEADLSALASSAQPESTDVAPTDSFAPHSNTGQSGAASGSVKQARHRPAPPAKPNNGLFARMQSFFHRVRYRQHGNGSQRDLYAHS